MLAKISFHLQHPTLLLMHLLLLLLLLYLVLMLFCLALMLFCLALILFFLLPLPLLHKILEYFELLIIHVQEVNSPMYHLDIEILKIFEVQALLICMFENSRHELLIHEIKFYLLLQMELSILEQIVIQRHL